MPFTAPSKHGGKGTTPQAVTALLSEWQEWDSNHRPSSYWMTHSNHWATTAPHLTYEIMLNVKRNIYFNEGWHELFRWWPRPLFSLKNVGKSIDTNIKLIYVKLHGKKKRCLQDIQIHIWCRSSSLFVHRVCTVAQNGGTEHWLWRRSFWVLASGRG